ncbi:hypothetical protein HYQ45_014534 [Verticillium longisporum]|uniref:Ribosomal RNA-processing protein 8 n=1 Tax=Verticillium longisporum TaxID=100787 RepID=A0A8I2Z9S4_VERLO|nr:hypothetical protein HYQ45_014534 [Verticillium longisporum]RBQ78212.1 hypothetical protein VDGD_08993 [Verticillium dahliae]
MFAVPGWSVSADALKPETQVKESASKPSKRKRAGAGGAKQEVTTDNVANLWERVIEGKPAPQKKKADKGGKKAAAKQNGKPEKDDAQPASKRQKAEDGSAVTKDEPERDGAPAKDGQEPPRKKTKKEKMREKKAALKLAEETKSAVELDSEKPAEDAEMAEANDVEEPQQEPRQELEQEQPAKQSKKDKKEKAKADKAAKPESTSSKPAAAPPLPPAVKLTPLQASMRAKLVSARFRHLNETLYTRPSAEALSLFTDSPDMFSEYHEGFRRQVEVWPENPVDGYIADIKARAKARYPDRNSRKPAPAPAPDAVIPLPRNFNGTATIADLGCGDARLAETLQPLARKLHLAIHSYDLHSPSPHVTRADIANLPLADGAADVAIFCLALMGTNWLDFIEEAYRILRWKGELWVAEIKSRFGPAARHAGAKGRSGGGVVEHSVGNRKKTEKVGKKDKAEIASAEAAADGEELAVEVDGNDDKRGETDVSAFVEALQKRGFVLQGKADLSNKMFVRMRFTKGMAPVKGKCVEKTPKEVLEKQKKQKRFQWESKEIEEEVDESPILKPCVYKLR